eukprot:CAMPEP_0174929880 /NCGR_PEP_ID=MMETSP1355-20121228/29238_1 /TAXON_ID=464990 /ORGANISM="Hemiselmis tepida, Strain CCMP443" /LENGTH=149 /DNA_ID=CAMNT_0016176131 /DNA_START=12 /DNA_END=458 /DNA_ORIENTATION=+
MMLTTHRALLAGLMAACLSHAALGFAPTARLLPSLRGSRGMRCGASSLKASMAEDEALANRMADIMSHEMDAVSGLEGGPPKREPTTFLGSKRLNKLKNKVLGQDDDEVERNFAIGFEHLKNELAGLKGTEGFGGGDDATAIVDGVSAV